MILATRARGEGFSFATLASNDVIEIRRKYATGFYSSRSLASEYGVKKGAIDSIVRRKTWKHIPEEDFSESIEVEFTIKLRLPKQSAEFVADRIQQLLSAASDRTVSVSQGLRSYNRGAGK